MRPTNHNIDATNINTEMRTLVYCLNSLVKQGFTADFKVGGKGLKVLGRDKAFQPEEVRILNFYRFEGDSDPADNSILYAIETQDGTRGTLVDAFGAYADPKVTTFMQKVEEINKKTNLHTKL
jgi:hypothetical protein